MKSYISTIFLKLLALSSICISLICCDTLQDVKEIDGSCTVVLSDGSTIVTSGGIKIQEKTKTITYRDEDGKLWSLFKDDYTSYTCE